MTSDDDDDLKLAIVLSMTEANQKKMRENKPQNDPIIISSDEENQSPLDQSLTKDKSSPIVLRSVTDNTATNNFLSQRAQLEAERLARARQRMQAQTDGFSVTCPREKTTKRTRETYSTDDEGEISYPSVKRSKITVFGAINGLANIASSSSAKTKESRSDIYFWDGELRQSANAHVEPSKDTRPVFRLHDILGEKSDLSFAILSSYVTQISWIYSLMPPNIPVILVGQPDDTGAAYVHNILPHWVKVTPFLRNGRGCMHVKLLLLFYKSGRLRVVIPTANLVDYDWRDVENSVWLQDIPPHKETIGYDAKAEDFPAQLERVLHHLHVSEGLKAILIDHPHIPLSTIGDLRAKWDFTQVRVGLIPSIAGKFEGWSAVLRVGHTRLMRAIHEIGARAHTAAETPNTLTRNSSAKKRRLYLECQTSSIGSYTPPWIEEFYLSACGASAENWLDEVKTKRNKRLDASVIKDGWSSWKHIKILFPSLNTVRNSRLGEDGAGTMFCRRHQWTAPRFPRPLFHDSNSKRGAVLMHTKMILGTFEAVGKSTPKVHSTNPSNIDNSSSENDTAEEDKEHQVHPDFDTSLIGWLYVGSHNFTPSAWGNLSGTSFTPIMNITNYELGVLIPLKESKKAKDYVSWIRPPRKYNTKDEPWIQGKD